MEAFLESRKQHLQVPMYGRTLHQLAGVKNAVRYVLFSGINMLQASRFTQMYTYMPLSLCLGFGGNETWVGVKNVDIDTNFWIIIIWLQFRQVVSTEDTKNVLWSLNVSLAIQGFTSHKAFTWRFSDLLFVLVAGERVTVGIIWSSKLNNYNVVTRNILGFLSCWTRD